MKSLGIAIIGCGFAGNFHSNAWVKVNYIDIKLKAAVDNNLERAQALKEKWNYEYATADYDGAETKELNSILSEARQ